MRKKIGILVIIIILIILVVGIYTDQNDKKLKKVIDEQIENLVLSQLEKIQLLTENGVYQIKIFGAEISDDIDSYKESLNTSAHITYGIFKHEETSEVLFHEGFLEVEIWRLDVEDDFHLRGNERNQNQSSRSILGQILTDFSWNMFSMESEKLIAGNPIDIGNTPKSSRSSSTYEEKFEMNDFGEITKPGEIECHSVHYDQNLSMTIKGHAYVENMNKPVVVTVEIAKEEGDYHPYWDLNNEQIKQIEFHYKDKYEGKITISDSSNIESLIEYIKKLQFEKFDEQIQNIDEYAYIMLDSYEHNIILSKDGVYTNSNHAMCSGRQYVDDILKIINDDSM